MHSAILKGLIGVNSVTVEKLKQLKYLKRELKEIKIKITELRNTLKSPCFYGGKRKGYVSDSVAKTNELLEKQISLFLNLQEKCLTEENEILDFIFKIDDSKMRQILKFRYIDGLSWIQTGHKLDMSPESVKMAHNRFFKKN